MMSSDTVFTLQMSTVWSNGSYQSPELFINTVSDNHAFTYIIVVTVRKLFLYVQPKSSMLELETVLFMPSYPILSCPALSTREVEGRSISRY